jgi:hypothetical protein
MAFALIKQRKLSARTPDEVELHIVGGETEGIIPENTQEEKTE